ncbi:Uu.00g109240.m01.CDS01 [Anthostomella pinea]|uniref:Uu.00g109240.m01.CDS01 n=1 Tax=Anthostomella pinea TaxID=933095 RepID=A0AAI8V9J0_9PEZI|nr:Uu.00g109240.m01.CDS01 [Anthostomella pinea]
MDPVSAIGFAAGILAFIDFSSKLMRNAHILYKSKSGTTEENAHIGNTLDDLRQVSQDLHLRANISGEDYDVKAIDKLAEQCICLSQELGQILERLQVKGKRTKRQVAKATWLTVTKKAQISSIEKRLGEYRAEIIFRLNIMTCSQNSSFQYLLAQLQQDCHQMGRDIAKQTDALNQELRALILTLQDDRAPVSIVTLRSTILDLGNLTRTVQRENDILGELYFESMYLRENSVNDPEIGTFEWLWYSLSPASSFRTAPSIISSESCLGSSHGFSSFDQRGSGSDSVGGRQNYLHGLEASARGRMSDAFASFLEADNGFFFICGKVGSGKSTIMKFIGSHKRLEKRLARWSGDRKLIFARFFFWKSGDRLQMSLEGFYRSILFEILKQCPQLITQITPLFGLESDGNHRINMLSTARHALKQIIDTRLKKHALCIMIDGLDEYEGDILEYIQLARLLKRWSEKSGVKVICSARPHTEFIDTFDDTSRCVMLHQLTRADIWSYAYAQLSTTPQLTADEQVETADLIVDMADGVFLWARLVVRSLLTGLVYDDSPKALKKRLRDTPRDLDAVFRKILGSIDPALQHRSDRMLSLALLALGYSHHGSLNALHFSWVEDLDDPEFPFNRPCVGYKTAEIERRHKLVQRQIDALTRGLLEMKNNALMSSNSFSRGIPKKKDIVSMRFYVTPHPTGDIFWENYVGFMHRSVTDFMRVEASMSRTRAAVSTSDYVRLRLAGIQFSLSLWNLDEYCHRGDYHHTLWPACEDIVYTLAHGQKILAHDKFARKALGHLRVLLDSFGQLQHSQQANLKGNSSKVGPFWGTSEYISWTPCAIQKNRASLDYWAWLASKGLGWLVIEELRKSADSKEGFIPPLNLLATSNREAPDANLVRYLFQSGLSPETLYKVNCPLQPSEHHPHDNPTEARPVSAWLLFLRMYLGNYLHPRLSVSQEPSSRDVLLEYLRAGATRDIVVLGYIPTTPPPFPPPLEITFRDAPSPDDIFCLGLKQALTLCIQEDIDLEMESLLRPPPPPPEARLWSSATGILSSIMPSSSKAAKRNAHMAGYRPPNADELKHPDLLVYGVISKDNELIGDFEYDVY